MRRLATRYWGHGFTLALAVVAVALVFATMAARSGLARTPSPLLQIRARIMRPAAVQLAPPAAAPVVEPQVFEPLTPDQAVVANARVPISSAPNPPARAFSLERASPVDQARALTCLTMAVYYEAGNQGPDGEAAVAQVVLNRVRSPLFPKTVCGVVFQGSELATGCQFTFSCDGSLGRKPAAALWRAALVVAQRALGGNVSKPVGVATHYHTIWVVPYWRPSVVKVREIGAHVFYRMEGGLGSAAGFKGLYAGGEMAPPRLKDFDTGVSPLLVAADTIATSAATQPAVATLEAAPQIIARPPQPVEVVVQTAASPAEMIAAHLDPSRPVSYFGGHGSNAQHLPMSSPW
jgi:spore germination cell wall hydrolase CwlJ-like protein